MRNLKRALSLALAALMLIGMMVVSAGAASKDFTDADEIQHKEAVNVMTTLNVVSGKDDGSYFAPNDTFTREEMAKVVSYVMNGGVEPVVGTKVTPTYSDIKGIWSEKYIEYCTSMGIIAGDGSGKFNPTGTLTAEQCAKMFLTAMGYDAKVFGFVGNDWAINVGRYANEAGLYEELGDIVATDPISRDDAMQMAYNAIQATMMKRSWSQDLTTGQLTETYVPWTDTVTVGGVARTVNHTLLLDKFNANMYEGTLTATGEYSVIAALNLPNNDPALANQDGFVLNVNRVNSSTVTADDTYFEYKDQDLTSLMAQYVKVLRNDKTGQVYGVFPVAGKNTTLETAVSLTDYTGLTNKVKVDGTVYNLENDIVYIKGEAVTASAANYTNLQRADKIVYVDNDGNGKFDVALITPVNVAEITFINDTNITFTPIANSSSAVNSNAQLVEDMILSKGLAKGDFAVLSHNYYSQTDTLTKVEVKSGTVSGVRNPVIAGQAPYNDYQIDGNWAKVAQGFTANTAIKSGSSVNYVVVDNVLFYAKLTSGATLNEVAVIHQMAIGNPDNFGNRDLVAKVMFSDGSTKEVVVDALYANVTTTANSNNGDNTLDAAEKNYIGVPLSYKVNNSGNYEFYMLTNTADNKAGFDSVLTNVGATRPGNEWTVGGTLVADNALIVVRNTSATNDSLDGKITYVSGSDYKKIAAGKFNAGSGAYALVGKDADGFSRVMFAIVQTTIDSVAGQTASGYNTADKKFNLGVVSGESYGYLTKDSWTETIDGASYNCFEIWNGTETVTVKEKNTAKQYYARQIIAYDNSGKGIIKNVSSVGASSYITAVNADAIEIAGVTYKLTKDTVIMNVNDADHIGVAGSATPLASEIGNTGVYYDNCYFRATNGELDVLVVDVAKNEITGTSKKLDANGLTAAALNAALSGTEPLVVVNGTVVATEPAPGGGTNAFGAVTVPAGKTLVINGNVTLGTKWTVNGALSVNGTLNTNALTPALDGTGTVNGQTISMGSSVAGSLSLTFVNAVVANNFTVGGTATLNVTGSVTNTNAAAVLTVNGGTLKVAGTTTTNLTVTTGNVTTGPVIGNVVVNGGTVVTGNVTGNVTATSGTTTTGSVSGNLTASGTANVTTGAVSGTVSNSSSGDVSTGGVYAQTVALRGKGPGKEGTSVSNFQYGNVYADAGVTLTGNSLNVALDTLVSFANADKTGSDGGDNAYGGSGAYSARHHLTQTSGEVGGEALFVGLAFGAPSELSGAKKVKVTMNGTALTTDGANQVFTLESASVSGTGNDTLDNAFVKYLPFAKAGTETDSNTAETLKIADNSYTFVFTWLAEDGTTVLGTSSCTITRTSK